jgi:hypothetical protein
MSFKKKNSALLILTELLYLLLALREWLGIKSLFMLRKLAFVTPTLLITIMINAQFKKGDKMLGASVGTVFLNSGSTDVSTSIITSTNSNDNFGLSINPSIGWFINDNIAVGIMPTAGYNKQKLLGKSSGSTYMKDESSRFIIGIGGFARYYFSAKNPKTRLFGQYDLSLGLSGSKSEGFQYETYGVYVDRYNQKSSGDFFANTSLLFGVSKFLTNKTSLDFYIGYKFSYIKSNPKGTFLRDYSDPLIGDVTQKPDYDQKFTGHNVVIGVGFQVFLEKKK